MRRRIRRRGRIVGPINVNEAIADGVLLMMLHRTIKKALAELKKEIRDGLRLCEKCGGAIDSRRPGSERKAEPKTVATSEPAGRRRRKPRKVGA
jgi:hypothetical protein